MARTHLIIIAPVYNEEHVVGEFHARLNEVLRDVANLDVSIIYAVDRCSDNTLEKLRAIIAKDRHVTAIALASRFGHQMSLMAGIDYVVRNNIKHDAIVMMDSDLQHPPEVIPELIEAYLHGHEVVYTIRQDSQDVGWLRRLLGNLFYKLLDYLSPVSISANAADFRLISRRVGEVLVNDFRERNMFMRGIFSWMGYRQKAIQFVAGNRFAGKSKYSLSRMMQLAISGLLSFSTRPLQASIFVGIGFALVAFMLMFGAVASYFIDRAIPSGWTTLVTLMLLFSGIQLIMLGIVGMYIGGIYEEVKGRPRYLIEEVIQHHD